MKTKALSKRLILNKETVSTLGNDQMKALHGGIDPTTTTAIPCQYSCDSCRITFYTCGCTLPPQSTRRRQQGRTRVDAAFICFKKSINQMNQIPQTLWNFYFCGANINSPLPPYPRRSPSGAMR